MNYASADIKLYATTNTIFHTRRIVAGKKISEESIEKEVIKRTRELVEANIAMEAFSYSVSHDLRAPIRTILGFTQIIQHEYADGFSADLKDLVNRIEQNARRMNHIVDDLLRIAKFEKTPLRVEPLDLNVLIGHVWDSLSFGKPHRAQLQLNTLPDVVADRSLIEQVLINLLCNAVKYSSKAEAPVIEVGCHVIEGKTIFYVKDNGAGFDMKYSAKLFKPFERLHSMGEFEGTGVGLSLAKNIIERHKGRIWAEATVNQGAVFYFTIGDREERAVI